MGLPDCTAAAAAATRCLLPGASPLAESPLSLSACAPQQQDKSKQKAKEKLVEDKTFGLKNKGKSAKVQKYVQQLQKSAQPQRNPRLEEPSRKVGRCAGLCLLRLRASVVHVLLVTRGCSARSEGK